MGKQGKKLVSNATFLFLDWMFVTLLGFVYWSVAGKTLLPEQYGIVSTSVNFATLLSSTVLFGLNTTLWKLIPEYLEKHEINKIRELIFFSFLFILAFDIILVIALIFLSTPATAILKVPSSVVVIIAINLLIVPFSTYFAAILTGTQDMKKIAVTDFIGQIVKILLSTALIFLGFSYFGPLVGFTLGTLTVVLARIPFKFFGRVKKEVLDKKQILIDFALPAFVANLAWVIFINGQYVLLTSIKNLQTTGIFTVALLLTSPIVSVPNVLSSALFPIIAQLSVNHNSKGRQRYLINMVFKYALLFSVPASIFLILFSNHFILLFSRSEYLSASTFFPILALASIIYGTGLIFNQNLYSLGKPKIQRNIILMTVSIFFILAIPLTIIFSTIGMCFAYLFSVSFLNFASYRNVRKILNMKPPWSDIKKILIAGSFSFIFLYEVANSVTNTIFVVILCIISGIIYLETLFLLKFYTKQDIVVLESIAEKSPIFKKQFMEFVNFLSKFV